MLRKTVSTCLLLILVASIAISMLPAPTVAQEIPQGPWVDEIIFSEEPDMAKAITRLEEGDLHTYFYGLTDPDLFRRIKISPELWYTFSYGSYNDLTFNPVGPEFPATGKLNPFSVPRIREAMNYLIDRKYIAEEICGGLAVPRYTALTPSFPDYARLVDTVREIEVEYSYDLEKARAIISEEMEKLGAELVDGKWHYKGEPVTLIFLIRVEDERREIGDYVASQLEKIGFTVDRQYKTSAEASPLWLFGDPADGKWHIYTGGWLTTAIARDQSGNFDFFYTPRGLPLPLWQAYTPDPEFDEVAKWLGMANYTTWDERNELMRKALRLSMKDSVRVWLVNSITVWTARNELELTCDLAGGFYGARLWPYTIRFKGTVGGTVKIATHTLLIDPWNPVGGSNWIYDQMIIRATYDPSLMADPFTGLYWPQRIKNAEVYVKSGLPVVKTLDWLTLNFVDEITVPTDAWYGWNATTKSIVTAPPGTTAKAKVVVHFEDTLFKNKFHDGTNMSLADFIFNFIITFDRADKASPIYDEAYVPDFESFREVFKGFKIISEDPLVVEYYTDMIYPDAEWIVTEAVDWFDPEMAFGPSPWHMVAIGMLAEQEKKLAFTGDKAKALGVEWMSYIAGPSIPILEEMLDKAIDTTFIPYKEVLGDYITDAEALARYQALKAWYEDKGHFWVGYGPFYLDSVDPTAKVVVLKAFREHPDTADKWAGFAEPMIPEVSVTAPAIVDQGYETEFTVEITYKGDPYKIEDMDFVKYLIIGPAGEISVVGTATPIKDGEWRITLSANDTLALSLGSNEIEVIASSKLVSIPSSVRASFVVSGLRKEFEGRLEDLEATFDALISQLEETLTNQAALISDLEGEIENLKASLASLSNTVTMLIAVAAISIIIALIGVVMAIRARRLTVT